MKQLLLALALVPLIAGQALAATQQQSGSVGVEGTIPSNPPTQAPTITTPVTGQVFTNLPITVAGLCPSNLLVEVFKNNIFSGAVQCTGGSYSIKIDLFSGRNDLIARAYDSLNQAGPDSNTVSVTFNGGLPGTAARISLTTAYAKRGANPGDILSWPLSISGGTPPYAISVDWGDKSTPSLSLQKIPGDFDIKHTYNQPGVYNIIIQASDTNGFTAFLQVVGVGNGPIQQSNQNQTVRIIREVLWWPIILLFALTFVAFWSGRKHELQIIRARLRRGQRPFK